MSRYTFLVMTGDRVETERSSSNRKSAEEAAKEDVRLLRDVARKPARMEEIE